MNTGAALHSSTGQSRTDRMPMLQLRDVSKLFAGSNDYALHPTSFNIATNEVLVLLGSSGSGKSTLLKLINRLLIPTAGEIFFKRQPISSYDPVLLKRSIGYVFQSIGLFPHLTVAENVSTVPHLQGKNKQQCQSIATKYLALVNLDPKIYAQRLPHELSGGQQQRVGVARALATEADLLLMDEPFGALDSITRDQLQQELLSLKQQLGKTIIFVTHDIFEALTLADRIAVLHQGRLHQLGTKYELVNQPATDFVRDLFKKPLQQLANIAADSSHG